MLICDDLVHNFQICCDKTINALEENLNIKLEKYEKYYGIEKSTNAVDDRFNILIETIYNKTGEKVVLLVDEYDKPLLECKDENLDSNRALFKGFFGNLKNSTCAVEHSL